MQRHDVSFFKVSQVQGFTVSGNLGFIIHSILISTPKHLYINEKNQNKTHSLHLNKPFNKTNVIHHIHVLISIVLSFIQTEP